MALIMQKYSFQKICLPEALWRKAAGVRVRCIDHVHGDSEVESVNTSFQENLGRLQSG